jgi:hypothetical protein
VFLEETDGVLEDLDDVKEGFRLCIDFYEYVSTRIRRTNQAIAFTVWGGRRRWICDLSPYGGQSSGGAGKLAGIAFEKSRADFGDSSFQSFHLSMVGDELDAI